jgi:hypothetical protein
VSAHEIVPVGNTGRIRRFFVFKRCRYPAAIVSSDSIE